MQYFIAAKHTHTVILLLGVYFCMVVLLVCVVCGDVVCVCYVVQWGTIFSIDRQLIVPAIINPGNIKSPDSNWRWWFWFVLCNCEYCKCGTCGVWCSVCSLMWGVGIMVASY